MNDHVYSPMERSRDIAIGIILFLVTICLFSYCVQYPGKPIYDEIYYVPAAMLMGSHSSELRTALLNGPGSAQVLQNIFQGGGGVTYPFANPEQPVLAKLIILQGIKLLGPTALGWRFMSIVFGGLTVVGMYFWALGLFQKRIAALYVAGLCLFGQMLFVQSRIATLDIFMVAFLVWALNFFSRTWISSRPRLMLALSGLFFGLSISCKWSGALGVIMVFTIVSLVKVLQMAEVEIPNANGREFYSRQLWSSIRWWDWALSLVVIPVAIYFLSFTPDQGFHFSGIFHRQHIMWELMSGEHKWSPGQSPWWYWPFLLVPMIYQMDVPPDLPLRYSAITPVGSPLIAYFGLIAILFCVYQSFWKYKKNAVIILAGWSFMYLLWALTPRDEMFSYYYFPSYLILSLALAYLAYEVFPQTWMVWARRAFMLAAIAVCIWELPVSMATSNRGTQTEKTIDSRLAFTKWDFKVVINPTTHERSMILGDIPRRPN